MKKIEKIAHPEKILDEHLDGGEDSRQILQSVLTRVLYGLAEKAKLAGGEVDWTTLDLRAFRDTSLDTMERDNFLTLRAQVLTKGEIS